MASLYALFFHFVLQNRHKKIFSVAKNKIMYAIFYTCLEKGNKFDLYDHENVFDVDFEGLLGFS